MSLHSDQGIVLRGYPFGEADRIVVLISPNQGKVRAVAKGVRRTKSRFGGRLEPLTHVDMMLYQGRNLATVTQVAVIEPFPRLRLDLDAVVTAGAMASAVDKVVVEGEPSHRLFLLLLRGLHALEDGAGGMDLMASFLLKMMDALGQAPALRHCASCGRRGVEVLDRFSLAGGGLFCDVCDMGGRLPAAERPHRLSVLVGGRPPLRFHRAGRGDGGGCGWSGEEVRGIPYRIRAGRPRLRFGERWVGRAAAERGLPASTWSVWTPGGCLSTWA